MQTAHRRHSLEHITTAASRAGTLIRQLLMFSRKQVMQFRHLDLNETLANTINMLERLVGEHVEITFRHSASLPAIHADTSMLEQIVLNLAVNARDAMPNGGKISSDDFGRKRSTAPRRRWTRKAATENLSASRSATTASGWSNTS